MLGYRAQFAAADTSTLVDSNIDDVVRLNYMGISFASMQRAGSDLATQQALDI